MPQIREQIAMVHLPPSKTLKYLFHVRKTRRRKLPIACGAFFIKVADVLTPLLLIFRKKSRSASLFGSGDGKSRLRPYGDSQSLPVFCGIRDLDSLIRNCKNIFFMCLSHPNKTRFSNVFIEKRVLFYTLL